MSVRILSAVTQLNRPLPVSLLINQTKIEINQKRTVIYYDRNTAKRLSDKNALDRFYRLHWGGWIRTRAGRKNHLWKKPWYIKWYTKQHVFCTEEMCQDLEKLITPEIKKPRYFLDDIYAPYHKRHGIEICPHDKLFVSTSYAKLKEEY